MSDFETNVPDESEQLDQLQAADSLVDRGVADVLDEGYVTPENWSVAQGFGNTPAEMRQGETIEQRVRQEEPEKVKDDSPWNPEGEPREVGSRRAGRLVDASGGYGGVDTEAQSIAHSVGIDGGAASAEEAAMHVIEPIDDEEED
jgi:hypothetical protein